MRILFSNLGYATGIDGSLGHHFGKAYRHAVQTKAMQMRVLAQFETILQDADPDICCLVEIDQGSMHSQFFNQIGALVSARRPIFDVANKYGPRSPYSRLPFYNSKSNGFLAKEPFVFEHLYFERGTKRLIYQIALKPNLTLFFAHFSLQKKVRASQFLEMGRILDRTPGEVIVLGDFNTFGGEGELGPLLDNRQLCLLNTPDVPTFRFHRLQMMLDLCLVSQSLAQVCHLQVLHQPFSDHNALLLEVGD